MQELIYLFEKFLVFISAPFIDLVNISITASWVVLAVVVIRFCLKKAPKWLSCALWGVVALRLVFPFSLESELSLIPSTQTINPSAIYNDSFEVDTGFSAVDNAVNGTVENTVVNTVNNTVDSTVNSLKENADVSITEGVGIAEIIAFVWLIGMFVMAGYAFISFLRLKLKLRTAVKKEGNIYQSESVGSPFVLGLLRPRIYMPYKTDEADIPLVVAHEKAHIKRFDHIIKPLGYLLLSVHWFNPLMWVAYILLCRDIEAACDEKVIKELGEDVRKSYSTALLNASISRRSVAACPLAFGEVGVKERIKGVMNYKKPAFWVIIAGVAVCIIAAVCLLTNPKGSEKTDLTKENTQGNTTVMAESNNNYELMVTLTKDEMVSRIDNEEFFKKNGYHVYLYFIVSDTARITIGGKNLPIGEAINSGVMSINKLLQKAEEDVKLDRARMELLKDGGTKIYKYNAYTIIKRNTTDGNKDLIISAGAVTLGNDGGLFNYSECIANIASAQEKLDSDIEVSDEINGVTADISPEAQPQLTGKVSSATDKVINMELTSDQGGIKKGTPVTVRLGSMLSYAPQIDTSKLKKGDIVTVIYEGRVMETYPLQIDAYAVYTVEECLSYSGS